jgi:hypothetical protein
VNKMTAPRGEASFSMASIAEAAKHDSVVAGMMHRVLATTYEEFLSALSDDLKRVIERIEDNPQSYPDESEDATTQRIADMLWGMQYECFHNLQAGGNVDLTVAMPRRQFKWIAEAKKFSSITGMREGYLQLATRYRPGMDANGVMNGGLIGYVRRPNAAKHMKDWRQAFANLPVAANNTLSNCERRHTLGFISEHAHQDYGVPLRVWHMCVVLYFAPKDVSGRTAKKYKTSAVSI